MLCQLEGVKGYRVWHDQTLIKEPFGNPTSWHLDNPYWSFQSRHAISIWIALEDATLENGCMWFVPGSLQHATYNNVGIGANMADLFKLYPKMAETDPVAVPMKAGDCSFHNGLSPTARRKHDPWSSHRDDVCLHADRQHIQRQSQYSARKPISSP